MYWKIIARTGNLVILARWKEMWFLAFCHLQVSWEQNTFTKADLENMKSEALGSPQSLASEAAEGENAGLLTTGDPFRSGTGLAIGWLWGCSWELQNCKASKILISMIRCPDITSGKPSPQKTQQFLCLSSFLGLAISQDSHLTIPAYPKLSGIQNVFPTLLSATRSPGLDGLKMLASLKTDLAGLCLWWKK